MPNGVLVKVGRVTVCVLSQNILDVNRNLSFASDSLRFSHPQPIVCDNPDLHFCEGLHLIKHPHCTQDPRPWVKTCNGLFYKRECQENTSPSARKAGRFPRHPAPSDHGRRLSGVVPLDWFCGCSISAAASSLSSDDADRFLKLSKPGGCTVSTMGLSEARGLVLFRVIRGGIGVTRRLGACRHRVDYRPLSYSPSNPSVSRTDWPPPEKDHRRWKGPSPETLKRLAISVFRRRSVLPSSTESA